MSRYDSAFDALMELEGHLSDHPNDPGGFTAWGLTQRDHPDLFVNGKTPTREEAKQAYRDRGYWTPRHDEIESERIAFELFEAGVLCGPRRATRFLQRAYNDLRPDWLRILRVDGALGPITVGNVNMLAQNYEMALYRWANYYQAAYFAAIVDGNEKLSAFLRGWAGKRLN